MVASAVNEVDNLVASANPLLRHARVRRLVRMEMVRQHQRAVHRPPCQRTHARTAGTSCFGRRQPKPRRDCAVCSASWRSMCDIRDETWMRQLEQHAKHNSEPRERIGGELKVGVARGTGRQLDVRIEPARSATLSRSLADLIVALQYRQFPHPQFTRQSPTSPSSSAVRHCNRA